MKRITLGVCFVLFSVIMYSSCYKTGETIYQPTCKPDSISVGKPLYLLLDFYSFFMPRSFQGSLTYDVNRRLVSATSYQLGSPLTRYDFIYDGNNNLVRINENNFLQDNTTTPGSYFILSYPTGTIASISATAQVQPVLWFGNVYTFGPVWTYNFNAQFQLQSVFQGSVMLQQLTYNFGGNCLTDSVYNQQGLLSDYYVYSSYDNSINPARSDRSLQLFFQMYNKNNPGSSIHYSLDLTPGAVPNSFIIAESSSGSYTYNIFNYPTGYAGFFFAQYDCQVTAPPPIKLPVGAAP